MKTVIVDKIIFYVIKVQLNKNLNIILSYLYSSPKAARGIEIAIIEGTHIPIFVLCTSINLFKLIVFTVFKHKYMNIPPRP